MNQKKTMNLWQMIMLLVLAVVILSTMFLPAYHINPDALKKGMEKAQIEEDYYENDDARDEAIEPYTKKFKNKLEKEKKENGTDNEKISPLKLMTKSLSDICYNGKFDEEHAKTDMGAKTYDALHKKHRITKILLWVLYGLVLLALLMIILGYCMKWTKYIPLAVSTVYGVFASIVFGILRFLNINGVKEEIGKLTEDFIGSKLKFDAVNTDVAGIAPGFLSYAFLLGLIAAAAFLILSVLSMFVGDSPEEDSVPDPEDDWDKDWNLPYEQMSDAKTLPAPGLDGAGYSGDTQGIAPFDGAYKEPAGQEIPQTQPSQPAAAVQEPQRKPALRNGKVRCTKGTTSGSPGYALSQDRKVVVGKSPHQANLVIVNNTHISNVHCTIRYDQKTDTYLVKDHSSNGTFVNGVRLQKETLMKYPAGTVLSLADKSVEITLG